jgi:23S rRNA (uracil1939-C5)-methyltransferase
LLKKWIGDSLSAVPAALRAVRKINGVYFHPQGATAERARPVKEGSTLIDLYCGSGAIGLSLAGEFESVIGVELNPRAIHDALINAEASHAPNVRFIEGKAEDVAATLPVASRSDNTMVVVDPPRPGLHPVMVKTLLDWSVPWLFYVSCNPESLARDLRALRERYDILDVQPMDFFPHTDHIETAVRLRRRTPNA